MSILFHSMSMSMHTTICTNLVHTCGSLIVHTQTQLCHVADVCGEGNTM